MRKRTKISVLTACFLSVSLSLVSLSGHAQTTIKRTYTPDGLPLTVESGETIWRYSYNKRRLLETEALTYGGATYVLQHTYDANGCPASITYPDNTSVAYKPNALCAPTQIGTFASQLSYHPSGAVKSFVYGNGIAHSLTQNARGLPSKSTDAGVLDDEYKFDQNANVTAILDWQEGISNREMEYDGADRLTRTRNPKVHGEMWGDAHYTYDALENLVTSRLTNGATARTRTHVFDAATNRLNQLNDENGKAVLAYDYDSQGNITKRGGQSYLFDIGNRMKQATGKATYVYDGWGRRVSIVGTDNVNRVQVYSIDGKLMYAGPTTGAKTKYIYLHKHLIAEVSGEGTQYVHTDGLGSPVARTNPAKAIVSRTRYEPYGHTAMGTAPTIGFTGHMNDIDTGLVYMQQRYYDPIAGRMLSIDPVTTDANTGSSFNRYAYANNNPYKYVDPDGRIVETAIDVISLGLSASAFKREPTFLNGLGLAYDGIATAVPLLPAGAGILRHGGNIADMIRGIEKEKTVLKEIGEVKNTQKVGTDVKTIPDYMNEKVVGDIKDVKYQADTKQMRAQREHAESTGRAHEVQVGTNTKVSGPLENKSTIMRRDDLGP